MRELRRAFLVGVFLILSVAIATGIVAWTRESKVKSIRTGMPRAEVERLLGSGRASTTSPACGKCPAAREQFEYEANASLWYGHFADRLIVCYVNGTVCDTLRIGL